MVKKLIYTILGFILILGSSVPSTAEGFTILSSPMPPYTMNKGLHLTGISVDVLAAIMSLANAPVYTKSFKLVPEGYAIRTVRNRPNHILLNAIRTKANDTQFKWVGPMTVSRYVLVGPKGASRDISIPDSLLNAKTATILNSSTEMALMVEGVPSDALMRSSSMVQPIKLLESGMVDYLASTAATASCQMSRMGLNIDQYKIVAVYKEVPLYFAFSTDACDAFIQKLNTNLEKLKEPVVDGKSQYEKIVRKYLPKGLLH